MRSSMAISSAEPRVLCVAPNWLGDAILARAALAQMGRAGVRIDVWARGPVGRVLQDLTGVQRVIVQPRRRGARFGAAWSMRQGDYDAVLVLPPSWSSAAASWLVRARLRVGYAAGGRGRWLTHALPHPGRTTHLQEQYGTLTGILLRELGCRNADRLPPPVLVADADERRAAQAALDAAGAHGPYAVLAPGARYGAAKKWPPERFAATAAGLRALHGWTVLLAGEGADAADTAAVRRLDPAAIDLAGRTSLAALVGLLAGARVVVANDSGTMHLAAALGRPVVGIFGSTSPAWTAPVGALAGSVARPTWCAPCFAKTCVQDFECMLRIKPEDVLREIASRLDAGTPSQRLP